MDENGADGCRFHSHAPLIIFLLVGIFQFVDRFFDRLKKRDSRTAEEKRLRIEISDLLKQASLLSTPSSFAQAAKLQRTAAAKEKELAKIQLESNDKKVSYGSWAKTFSGVKFTVYLGLIWWFWGVPVAVVPRQLLQPLGRMLSWKAGDPVSGVIEVGMIPWLVLTARVSKLLSQKLIGPAA
ncbi:tail-anchored protein insertion receptor WRB-like protein [Wolffia australiana]